MPQDDGNNASSRLFRSSGKTSKLVAATNARSTPICSLLPAITADCTEAILPSSPSA